MKGAKKGAGWVGITVECPREPFFVRRMMTLR